jgi:hypothetical protein
MTSNDPRQLLKMAMIALGCAAPGWAHASSTPPIDAGLYTTYQVETGGTAISWVTCGTTTATEGCFDSGTLSPFHRACAILEGASATAGNTVTRFIYVLDAGKGKNAPVVLRVFKKTDVISSSFDTTTIVLKHAVTLSLTGGGGATCQMAANGGFIFAGTDASTNAVQIAKAGLTTQTIGGFDPPMPVAQITANNAGYVTVTFVSKTSPGVSGFVLYGPDGTALEDGGGAPFIPNQVDAVPLN